MDTHTVNLKKALHLVSTIFYGTTSSAILKNASFIR